MAKMRGRLMVLGLVLAATVAFAGPRISFVQGYSFDPLSEKPNLPENLTVQSYSGTHGYYIVQFEGPVRPEWKKAAERAGAELMWYLPDYAFIARIPNDRVAAVWAATAVRWVGLFQPAYKLYPKLEAATGRQTLIVVFFKPEDPWQVTSQLLALGASNILTEFNQWNSSVKLDIDAAAIPAVAQLPGVLWVEPWGEITPDNENMQWVNMHGYSPSDTTRTIWRKGLTGRTMIIGLTDTPMWMNHNAVRDTAGGSNVPGPTHRKVVAYRGTQGSDAHGTHTSGTVAGDDDYVGGTSWHDGLAKHARLYFQNYNVFPTGWDMNIWFRGPDSGLNVLNDSFRALNHSMSLSRKDTFNTYVFTDMTADQFVWNHRKFLHCNSMGNYGNNTMGHPVIAKNIISTGGTQNGFSCRNIYSSTSRGPTLDGRRKPQLVSPGENVYSNSNSSQSGYVAMSGTSMATPNMTASMALIRQYFRKGFYPTGDTLTGTPMTISAALNKAVGIVGAQNDVSGYTVPDNNIGWGRVNLDSSLHFAGEASKLWVNDDTVGLNTGDSALFTLNVVDGSQPFRVALCWSDYPGVMQAQRIIVNDLNLTVIAPNGDTFKGSVYSGGQSVTGGVYDSLNVEECTRRNSPVTGIWTIKVKARNVPQGPQPFALAAIGAFAEAQVRDVGVAAILAPIGLIDSAEVVAPKALIQNFGTTNESFDVVFTISDGYADTVGMTLSAGMGDTAVFDSWPAFVLGWFDTRCTTLLSGDENAANDVAEDSFRVIPLSGVAEGGNLPKVFSLEPGRPNPFSRRVGIRYGLPRAASIDLAVYSVAGVRVRTLASGELAAGWYGGVWDGRDNSGRLVSRGVYYCRLTAPGAVFRQKLVKLD
uniref:Peptidase S8/S53 domain-containing protein n=1 Tax=candidate division WOR-3 bacterium TaxID=2052148 RepID=A0A7C4CF21_UNCW3